MAELLRLVREIRALDEHIAGFELKYGVLSETFFDWYQRGEEPEDDAWVSDFAMWAGAYKSRLRRVAKYRQAVQTELETTANIQRLFQFARAEMA